MEFLFGYGVLERELPRVEEEAWGGEFVFFAVDGIAEDGCAEVVKVDADLVGAPGMKVAKNQSSFGGWISG